MATYRILLLCWIFFLSSREVRSDVLHDTEVAGHINDKDQYAVQDLANEQFSSTCRCDRDGNGICRKNSWTACSCNPGYAVFVEWDIYGKKIIDTCRACRCGHFIQSGTNTPFACRFNERTDEKTCDCDAPGYYKTYDSCQTCDCGQVIESGNETRLFRCNIEKKNYELQKTCICDAPDFYIKNGRCENHDECKINNGGCEHVCKSCNGSYYCECPEGSFLKEDRHTCQKECSYNISLVDTKGSPLQSPSYPEDYPNNTLCDYLLHTLPGQRIEMQFRTFHVERPWDFVTVYDGMSNHSALLGNFTGHGSPKSSDILRPIRSSENYLYVVFKSDYLYEYKGFDAKVRPVCGRDSRELVTKGVIYSHPQYGRDKYDNNLSCNWRLEGMSNRNVKLSFTEFDLELDYNCANDSIEIFDGGQSSTSFGKYCGTKIPGEFFSTNGVLSLTFITNKASRHWGFKAMYEII